MAETTDPNARLRGFLAEHQVTPEGICSCGWDVVNYDLEPYDFGFGEPETRQECAERAWIAHLENTWREANPLGDIQGVEVTGPQGTSVAFTMEPGHDTLMHQHGWGEQTGLESARGNRGAYRFADYERPPDPPGSCSSKKLTCEEAGCRDPHCLGVHFSYFVAI